jgi:hypothetical protein
MYPDERNGPRSRLSETQQVQLLAEKVEELLIRARRVSQTIEKRVCRVLDNLPELRRKRSPGTVDDKLKIVQYCSKERRAG